MREEIFFVTWHVYHEKIKANYTATSRPWVCVLIFNE